MRRASIFWLPVFLVLAATAGSGQAAPDPWLIVTTGGNGPLNLHTTHEDLVRVYGAVNVVDRDEVDGFSGDMEHLAILFPKDPQRSLEISWRDPDKKTIPAFVTLREGASRWHGTHGISLGTSLKELEHINGRPFGLSGFGWDYAGTVNSWQKGLIEDDFQGHGRVIVRLNYSTHAGVRCRIGTGCPRRRFFLALGRDAEVESLAFTR
jgi:hypothetical protein